MALLMQSGVRVKKVLEPWHCFHFRCALVTLSDQPGRAPLFLSSLPLPLLPSGNSPALLSQLYCRLPSTLGSEAGPEDYLASA